MSKESLFQWIRSKIKCNHHVWCFSSSYGCGELCTKCNKITWWKRWPPDYRLGDDYDKLIEKCTKFMKDKPTWTIEESNT